MSQMALGVEAMPDELRAELEQARADLLTAAQETDAWLAGFFEDTWLEVHTEHEVDAWKLEDGERIGYKVTVKGTPDFNEYDRMTSRYAKAVSKLRWLLWNIDKAASPDTNPTPEEGKNDRLR